MSAPSARSPRTGSAAGQSSRMAPLVQRFPDGHGGGRSGHGDSARWAVRRSPSAPGPQNYIGQAFAAMAGLVCSRTHAKLSSGNLWWFLRTRPGMAFSRRGHAGPPHSRQAGARWRPSTRRRRYLGQPPSADAKLPRTRCTTSDRHPELRSLAVPVRRVRTLWPMEPLTTGQICKLLPVHQTCLPLNGQRARARLRHVLIEGYQYPESITISTSHPLRGVPWKDSPGTKLNCRYLMGLLLRHLDWLRSS